MLQSELDQALRRNDRRLRRRCRRAGADGRTPGSPFAAIGNGTDEGSERRSGGGFLHSVLRLRSALGPIAHCFPRRLHRIHRRARQVQSVHSRLIRRRRQPRESPPGCGGLVESDQERPRRPSLREAQEVNRNCGLRGDQVYGAAPAEYCGTVHREELGKPVLHEDEISYL